MIMDYLDQCKSGKHEYITIYDGSHIWSNDEDFMIYWCEKCGSVKGCYEFDGRFSRKIFFNVPKVSVDAQKKNKI